MTLTTWRKEIGDALRKCNELWEDVVFCTLSSAELDRQFHGGWLRRRGRSPFTLWTTKRVYFPVCYDGVEWVDSVPRNPCGEATEHVGGG